MSSKASFEITPPEALRLYLTHIDAQIAQALEHLRGLYALEANVLAALGTQAITGAAVSNEDVQACEIGQVA